MPILKQLTSNQSKRRSRADLTAEMISAPLGDFRHTMHVGRGGDAFGDTSFLSTRSGEPPKEQVPEVQQSSPGPKPGLLSRTFRSSKRSQSVNRGDMYKNNSLAPHGGSPNFVKNAISLPYLNDEDVVRMGGGQQMPKSVSSSPLKKLPEVDGIRKPVNGASAMAMLDLEFDERNFGELTDLPPSHPRGGGMKHAESIMSFHIDLGPSMLGDILSVMEKKGWEEDDLGYEEGKGSEGRGSPPFSPPTTEDEIEDQVDLQAPVRPPRTYPQQKVMADPLYTPRRNYHPHSHLDSCSVSSSGSAALEEKPLHHLQEGDTDSAKYSSRGAGGEDDKDFSFMDEDDDEIRV
ncbi:cdc42 effector protein 4-like [Oncorhynchus kisutch]|uniref:CDC42 effector protein 4 n=1 Tax=Oncorhynchus kisutch TaxID=8019 RepID=A0A8C7L3Z4_ONCKI|nr:cdc42 effector protein 4-like [Oncorhynchus kisutch]